MIGLAAVRGGPSDQQSGAHRALVTHPTKRRREKDSLLTAIVHRLAGRPRLTLVVLATTAIVAALFRAVSALIEPRMVPSVLGENLAPAATALLVTGVCLSYPVWVMLSGPYQYQGLAFTGGLSAGLLGAVKPTSSQLLAPAWAISAGDRLAQGNFVDTGSYLGLAFLVLLTTLLVRYWRSRRMRRCAIMVALCHLFTLRPNLIVSGVNAGFPLPFALHERLPLLDNILTV